MELSDTQINILIGFVMFGVPILPAICCCKYVFNEEKRERERERGSAPTVTQSRPPHRAPLIPTTTQVQRPRPVPAPLPLPREPSAASSFFNYGVISGKYCVICQKEFVEEDKCEMLAKCNHIFHHDCIKKWQATGANCPLCRAPINGSS